MAELIVALDFPTKGEAVAMAERLRGRVRWMKVGLELFCSCGPDIVLSLKKMGFSVFLDLKFLDIPNTISGAVTAACASGADMLTIHVSGGRQMAESALESRERSASARNDYPLIMGVTLLTSMGADELGGNVNPLDLVLERSGKAAEWGLDGVVCSGLEAGQVRSQNRDDFKILTPGIRLAKGMDDQKRVVTPEVAVRAGSNFLVVGRPVTKAAFPEEELARFSRAISLETKKDSLI